MRNIAIIAKREIKGYFTTPLAYIFIVIFLAMSGAFAFYIGGFFNREQASLATFFLYHPWLYLMLVPAIAMRLWAEERKTGTIELEAVTIGENGVGEDDILVHDETSRPLAAMLAAMQPPALPVAMGILLRVAAPAYEASVYDQIAEVSEANPPTNLNDVLRKGPIWTTGV